MIDAPPSWISPPSFQTRQTELFGRWRVLFLESIVKNPPFFLSHLSPLALRKVVEEAAEWSASEAGLQPLALQMRIYERQAELICWSYFVRLGQELNNFQDKLSGLEFEILLREIGISTLEAELSMLMARQEANSP